MNQKPLNQCTAGELAALYILVMRGIVYSDFTLAEIQNALESLVGDLLTINSIRNVRFAIDEQ
jgi:hypothetical protein